MHRRVPVLFNSIGCFIGSGYCPAATNQTAGEVMHKLLNTICW